MMKPLWMRALALSGWRWCFGMVGMGWVLALIAGGHAHAQTFTSNANATVTDNRTGLVWDACAYGLSGAGCATGTAWVGTWAGALQQALHANANDHLGASDWRVPNKNELNSLAALDRANPAIDTAFFPNTGDGVYWTSSVFLLSSYSPSQAWVVGFDNGIVTASTWASNYMRVRLVRAGVPTATAFDAFPPVSGACGQAHQGSTPLLQAPSTALLCSVGTASAITPTPSTFDWGCAGLRGGRTASCSTSRGYTVTPSTSTPGRLSPSTPQTVGYNGSTSFTALPDTGYEVSGITGCGGTHSAGIASYTTAAITADCTVQAVFSLSSSHTLIATSTQPSVGVGTVNCAPHPVALGGAVTCTATAQIGHVFDRFSGACSGSTCSFNATTPNPSVTAHFVADAIAPVTLNGPRLNGYVTHQMAPFSVTTNEAGTGYWWVQAASSPAPDVATLVTSGTSIPLSANTAATFSAFFLSANTAYKLYFVAQDGFNNRQSAFQELAFSTLPLWPENPSGRLNDTGHLACTDTNNTTQPCTPAHTADVSDLPRQGARFGRDAAAQAGQLVKTGAGSAGFDFTRLCWSGAAQGSAECQGTLVANTTLTPSDSPSTDWACTKDHVTNLVWSLHSTAAVTWSSLSAPLHNQGHNFAARCGYSGGWRMPTVQELSSLLDRGQSALPLIDQNFFPGTFAQPYWASGQGRVVDFESGHVQLFLNPNAQYRSRRVRSAH